MSIQVPENFYRQTITRAVTLTGATNIYVSAHPSPSEGYVTISPSSSSLREIVYYTAKGTDGNGTYITVTLANRGLGGTTAQTHAIGEAVRMNVTAQTIQDISDAIDQIVAAGAQDASTSTKGIAKLSVAPVSASIPIAVGDNDPRLSATTAFGDGSDGDVTISTPTTLTRDMYYNNLVVNDTLTTNGFLIFVKDTISGTGTIKYPDASNGGNATVPSGSSGSSGAGGTAGTGGTGGTATQVKKVGIGAFETTNVVDINISSLPTLSFKMRQVPSGGGGGGGSKNGTRKGSPGGGSGASGGIVALFANTWAGTFTIRAIGGNGGNGAAIATGTVEGTVGAAGAAFAGTRIVNLAGAAGGLSEANGSNGSNGNIGSAGSAGGNGGAATISDTGAGGGGAGGNGGAALILYKTKTWTGSYVLTGGTGGTGANSGANGATGSSYEIPITSL